MKIPEKAPSIEKLDQEQIDQVRRFLSPDFRKIINRANAEYLYWDRFKYESLPEGVSPETAWFALKIARGGMAKPLPLALPGGRLFNYWVPDSAQAALHFIDQNAAGQIPIDEPITKKEKDHYVTRSIVEEAISSSLIEGAATTRAKATEMFKTGRRPRDRGEQMIYNNYQTILKIKDLLDQPLTPELLTALQGSMTKDTLESPSYEGRFREVSDDAIEVVDMEGHILHLPPAASEIPGMIGQFCSFANGESEDEFIHPVVKGILLHFWLAYIHPFMDGNGRTSRAIFYWYLLKKKCWLFEYLSISRIILRAPSQYYRAFLYSEMDDGDIAYFITFHLRVINIAIKELRLYLERKQRESRDAMTRLRGYPNLNYRQRALLLHALSHSEELYTIQAHMKSHGIVYQTARTDLLDLEAKGFLEKIGSDRKFTFVSAKDLEEKIREEGKRLI